MVQLLLLRMRLKMIKETKYQIDFLPSRALALDEIKMLVEVDFEDVNDELKVIRNNKKENKNG